MGVRFKMFSLQYDWTTASLQPQSSISLSEFLSEEVSTSYDPSFSTTSTYFQQPAPIEDQAVIKREATSIMEEKERLLLRRERNRLAATKCRNKKKEKLTQMLQTAEAIEKSNNSLRQEIYKLEAEKRHLVKLLMMKGKGTKQREEIQISDDPLVFLSDRTHDCETFPESESITRDPIFSL